MSRSGQFSARASRGRSKQNAMLAVLLIGFFFMLSAVAAVLVFRGKKAPKKAPVVQAVTEEPQNQMLDVLIPIKNIAVSYTHLTLPTICSV